MNEIYRINFYIGDIQRTLGYFSSSDKAKRVVEELLGTPVEWESGCYRSDEDKTPIEFMCRFSDDNCIQIWGDPIDTFDLERGKHLIKRIFEAVVE